MTSKRIVVDGLDEALDKLDELNAMQQDKALELGLARGAAKGIERTKAETPVQSGDLRDSMHVGGYTKLTPGYRPIGAYGALKGPIGTGKSKAVLAGSRLPYAHLVEMGSKRNRPVRMLLRGMTQSQGDIVTEVEKAIQEIIDR